MRTLLITNGDLTRDPATGRFRTVAGRAKAGQDVRSTLEKEPGVQGDGCGLGGLSSRMPDSPSAFQVEAARAIRRGFDALASLEGRFRPGQRRPDERVVGVDRVSVNAVANRPTDFMFRAEVKTQAGPPLAQTGTLVTPPA